MFGFACRRRLAVEEWRREGRRCGVIVLFTYYVSKIRIYDPAIKTFFPLFKAQQQRGRLAQKTGESGEETQENTRAQWRILH